MNFIKKRGGRLVSPSHKKKMRENKIILSPAVKINLERIEDFKPVETKTRTKILQRQSEAKTFKGWLDSSIKLFKEEHKKILNQKIYSPNDILDFLDSINNKYKELSLEKIELGKEHGKSIFQINYEKDIIEVITYVNKKPVTTKIRKVEKEWVENYLLKELENKPQLESIETALIFAKEFDYKVKTKRDYYSARQYQNFWTILLRTLRKEGIINYEAGIIKSGLNEEIYQVERI